MDNDHRKANVWGMCLTIFFIFRLLPQANLSSLDSWHRISRLPTKTCYKVIKMVYTLSTISLMNYLIGTSLSTFWTDNNAALLQFLNNARNNGCIPTSNNQTLVIGPLISNTQAGNYTQQGQQGKPNDMNKVCSNKVQTPFKTLIITF